MKTNKEEFFSNPQSLFPNPQTLCLLLMLLMANLAFSQTVWDGTADTTWYTNNKSLNEYTITTAEQLAGLARLVNGSPENGRYYMGEQTITLGNDIILNDTTDWQNWNENTIGLNSWTAIGYFYGTFDGNGHVISGIYINTDADEQGLFGRSLDDEEGAITNLGVEASYIKGGNYIGGLVGYNRGTISNSYFTGTISGISEVGGLVGYNRGTISNSYSTGTVSGTSSVGGLVGMLVGGIYKTISSSLATGTVTGTGNYVGGLVGYNNPGFISESYATGAVSGGNYVGGLTGDGEVVISNSQATGEVSGTGNYVGGLAGRVSGGSEVYKSNATGTVTGTGSDVGGLVGSKGNSYVFYSYYDIQTSGQSDEGKGEGKTTEEMKTQSTYVSWDFSDTWGMSEETNNGYPYLLWADTYNIAYSANGGTDAPEAQVKVKGIALILRDAIPTKENYTFTSWNTKADGTGTDYTAGGSYSIDAEHTLYARWALNTYTVKFIDHDETELKVEYVEHGSSASAPEDPTRTGYTFTGWDTEFDEITSNLTVTATYTQETPIPVTYAIIAIPANSGGSVDGSGTYEHDANIIVTATANDGYEFVNWTENGIEVSTEAIYQFTAIENRILVANFEAQFIPINTLQITAIPANLGGSVEGSGTYEHGENVTVTATANDGYNFLNWTENGIEVSTDAIYQFTATENRILVANFEAIVLQQQITTPPKYTIITIPANVDGSVEGSGTYEHGTRITVTAIANFGYKFVNWTDKGIEVSTDENYQFTAIEDRILVANFEAESTPILLPQIASGQISVQATNSGILLANLPNNAKVELYNLQGKQVYLGNSGNSQILQIMIQTKGIYIVKVGSKTFKVVK